MDNDDNNSELSDISDHSDTTHQQRQRQRQRQRRPNDPLLLPPNPHASTRTPSLPAPTPASTHAASHDAECMDDDGASALAVGVDDDDGDDDYAEGRVSPSASASSRKRKASSRGSAVRTSRPKSKAAGGGPHAPSWDGGYSPERSKRPTRKETAETGPIAWPVATVKRIMRQDPDMMHISAEAAYAIAQAGEVFLTYLCEQALECARASAFKRNMAYKDFATAVRKVDNLAFLEDTIPHTLTLQKAKEKKKELEDQLAAGKNKGPPPEGESGSSDALHGKAEETLERIGAGQEPQGDDRMATDSPVPGHVAV
ncbi:hypothetical protein SeMB42_g07738 [Synchytrium endobioticum]|uniref:Transcription factor CBF/NF-Y/archaeal histone domain-containing protein n=1 Tax=Synchytrium endobioticum TaxID=286115 RepID=A0A507CVW1_9FUNG|nr:hypothetical protein SeMB42_g07738 [Synchytrium endobioticum]TPX43362.1 hypothetical protein SeLEV6574_g05101 [Synchytrium endobioticum]